MSSTARHCKAKNRRGEPCGAYAVAGSEFCFFHDPGQARARAAGRKRGGHARHGRRIGEVGDPEPVAIASVGDVMRLLEQAVNDLLRLENSIARGRALLQAVNVGVRVLEIGELEARLAALEDKLL